MSLESFETYKQRKQRTNRLRTTICELHKVLSITGFDPTILSAIEGSEVTV